MNKKNLVMYAKLCVEFYDMEEHPNHEHALSFYMRHAKMAQGPILEPMCGSGRFLIPMLKEGLDVEGFDASSHMLNALRQKYSQITEKEAPVTEQFVQDFVSDKYFSLIFIPYGSWGLITDMYEVKKALEVLFRRLLPGGKFIIEIETVASVCQPVGISRRATHTRADGLILALSFTTAYNDATQLFQSYSRYESIINNKIKEQEEELFEQYLYRIDELDYMLDEVGFTQIKKYPAFDPTQQVDLNTPIIIYECIR
jgi:SAM-dependent methyltransferase